MSLSHKTAYRLIWLPTISKPNASDTHEVKTMTSMHNRTSAYRQENICKEEEARNAEELIDLAMLETKNSRKASATPCKNFKHSTTPTKMICQTKKVIQVIWYS